ncbi:14517_t:CDS:2 [Cetraspora pellucida]|uniref:14517_t:CDS:1 n=1 Tax=Cetraspora pellucida TaxID=1433469 RepID=A0ACA9LZD6_9GLOM|nr:14517_t:CDS:2 [Cetraspora pellucida]
MTLDIDITQDLPQDRIAKEEMSQIETIKEVTITQEKDNEVKKAPYTRMSRTTVWRKKQKDKPSLNVKALPDLSHLFPVANIVNRLQLPQPSSAVLLANALSLQKPESHSPSALKTYIKGMVFPQIYDENKKGVYYDRHERSDVVAYRKEWLKRMFTYKKSMKDFNGEMLEIVIEPQLEHGHKELVQVINFFSLNLHGCVIVRVVKLS